MIVSRHQRNLRGLLLHGVRLVNYKGVEYSVTATSEPDVWQWRFQIGERAATGKTRTRLVHMASRRVHMKIDAALKGTRVPEPVEHEKS